MNDMRLLNEAYRTYVKDNPLETLRENLYDGEIDLLKSELQYNDSMANRAKELHRVADRISKIAAAKNLDDFRKAMSHYDNDEWEELLMSVVDDADIWHHFMQQTR